MALDPVVNFFQSEIATLPVASGGTVIVLSSGDGAKLPNPAVDGAFNLTIYEDGNPFSSPEIVRVTGRSSDTLTVTRAQEGTTATTKIAGTTWKVVMFPTAKTIQDIDSKKVEKTGDTMTGTLTATKLIPSGNVTAGNGMYLPAANTVAVSTNGVERYRVTSTGNVGIGTTAPATRLEMTNVFRVLESTFSAPNTGTGLELRFNASGSIGSIFSIDRGASDWKDFQLGALSIRFFLSGTEQVRIDSAGNVGIGTTRRCWLHPFIRWHPIRYGHGKCEYVVRLRGRDVYTDIYPQQGIRNIGSDSQEISKMEICYLTYRSNMERISRHASGLQSVIALLRCNFAATH
jgi:hypothetical protein